MLRVILRVTCQVLQWGGSEGGNTTRNFIIVNLRPGPRHS